MMGGLIAVGVVLLLIAIVAIFVVSIYNSLVAARNHYKNAFSQISVQLKRRYDLIPNLVETVKGYMKHERETLEAVVRARNAAVSAADAAAKAPGNAEAMRSLAGAEGTLTATLGRLLVVQEQYPELKADKHMASLQEELTSTENRVAFARQAYNDAVTSFNTQREKVPAVFFASMLGFQPAALLEAVEAPHERNVPKVAFS